MLSHHVRSITALVVGALALAAGTASAKPTAGVACGQVLTHSVKLTADLENCPGDGLVVGADGITVDLDGHTIDGVPRPGCDFPAVSTSGVSDPGGYDRVTVKGGTVQQFDTGFAAFSPTAGLSDGQVRGLVLRDNRFGGVGLGGGAGPAATARNQVEHNTVSGSPCGDGLKLNTGQDNRFADNRVEHTAAGIDICCSGPGSDNTVAHNEITHTTGIGVLVFDSGDTRVHGNTLSDVGDNGIQIIGTSVGAVVDDNTLSDIRASGVAIVGVSSNAVIDGNTLTRVQDAGIGVFGCTDPDHCDASQSVPTGIRITDNALDVVGDAIRLNDTDRAVVRGNAVTGAGTFGPGSFGLGVLLNGVSDTVVAGNAIDGGRGFGGPGILIGVPPEFGPSLRPVARNTVVRNSVVDQAADGLWVASTAQDTTLRHNVAEHNAADGIHVSSAATTLRRNRADENAAFGIEAVAGVVDGGGNRAAGNGGAAQCTGVACR